MKSLFFLLILSSFTGIASATVEAPKAAKSARVHFIEPKDGATVPGTFTVKMGVEGMTVKKAGEELENKKAGHHHLIVNGQAIAAGTVIPADEKHLHFGNGQTETTLTLPPGRHRLTLQFADGAHKSYGDPLSETITVNVEGAPAATKK